MLSKLNFSHPISQLEFDKLLLFLYSSYPNQSKVSIQHNASMPKREQIYTLFDCNNQMIGSTWVIDLEFNHQKVGGIGGVTISEKLRGEKIGSYLIDHILNTTKKYDTYLLWTRVSPFFESLGFLDFSYGIDTIDGDSTPMIWTRNTDSFTPHKIWPRIKF